ncbi:hypothetical protein CCH79_00005161 [Gambusia affinis]|uniref:Uncharacterized protein n=1 Tax=Gambusia affinis TaxID=33528 RepID=A0A315VQR3_GAMAF|nr:hypothetical protein CCH79_00005161 [Gambusia affinis]
MFSSLHRAPKMEIHHFPNVTKHSHVYNTGSDERKTFEKKKNAWITLVSIPKMLVLQVISPLELVLQQRLCSYGFAKPADINCRRVTQHPCALPAFTLLQLLSFFPLILLLSSHFLQFLLEDRAVILT